MYGYKVTKQQTLAEMIEPTIQDTKSKSLEGRTTKWHFVYDSNIYMFRMFKLLGILPINRQMDGKQVKKSRKKSKKLIRQNPHFLIHSN